jgi:uncharacterized protein (DUF433 family)
VTPSTPQTAAEQNPVEVPLYTLWDAARYLRVPPWAVSALTGRLRGWPDPEWFFHHWRGFPHPLIRDDVVAFPGFPEERERFTFRRFADLFVRAAAVQCLGEWARTGEWRGDRWESIGRGVWRGLEDTERESVFSEGVSADEWIGRFVEPFARRLGEAELDLLRKWLVLRLDRVELRDGVPTRIYPFSRDPAENSPRTIVLDPRIRFGRPTIAGRAIPTDCLFERHQAGDAAAELADDYGLTAAEVEEALRYEAMPPALPYPFYAW